MDDPRFPSLTAHELDDLDISVDILSSPEPAAITDLNVKKYGIIVENGNRRGLLLPALDGVNSTEQQINIARRKAGIRNDEPIKLYRFTVKRYF